jgi:outer membrane protein assembly factor BamA
MRPEDPRKGKFKQENIFLGTGLNLGLSDRSFNVGLNPEIGYSITRWLDAGVALNLNYFSQNASDFSSKRYRNFNYGGGTFLRIWPVTFFISRCSPSLTGSVLQKKM